VAEPVLALESLTKRYGALLVSDAVSLTIAPGELHAVIGPNGAGKTTLIGQIAGALAPDSGRILFNGRDVTRLPAHARARLGLARSFQISSVIPSLSADENVALAAQARSAQPLSPLRPARRDPELDGRTREALAELGLSARADVPAGELSHGERRALELAIALALEPTLMVLDEPMAGTGHDESRRLVEILQGLKRRVAILLVEHDMDAVFALADRVSVLVYGRVIACGTPDAVRADPAVRAAYLGEEAV